MASIFKSTANRIPELDGIRGLALIMVLIYHLINNQILLTDNPSQFEIIIRKLSYFTWSALDLFFVLSGYLIAKVLIENKSSENYFRTFYIRRILRIMPLFYLLLLCYYILRTTGIADPEGFLFNNELPLWSYFVYIQNYMMAYSGTYGAKILTPTWSLGLDEQFYLLLPAILYFFKKEWIPYAVVPLIIAAPIFRASTDMFYMKILPFQMRMDGLFIGVLLAYFVCEKELLRRTIGKGKLILAVILVLLTLIFFLTYFNKIGELNHSLFNVVFALLILSAISFRKGLLSKLLSSRVLQFFGFVSYGTYLFHQFISGILHATILNQQPRLSNLADFGVTMLTLVLSILVGFLLHLYIEKPLIKLGHVIKYN
jgi:peptidoglycan/LPS O-acetylase OafA/YrhL